MSGKICDLSKILDEYLEMWFDHRGDEIESIAGTGGHLGAVDFVDFVKEIESADDDGY